MTFLILKYGKKRLQQDGGGSRSSRCGSRHYRESSAFFIKPYLTIEPLDRPETNNITISNVEGAGYNTKEIDSEEFKGKVWTLKTRSKEKSIGNFCFSKTADNCRIGLGIIRNNRTLFEALPLHWQGPNKLSGKCSYYGRRQQHASALPSAYVARLLADNKDTVEEFLVGTENYALLLFTFEGCEHVYVITHRNHGNIDPNITPLDFGTEYLFHVRMRGDGFKELRQKRFKFVAKSWDNITFQMK
jgi:hypothetical protein